MSASTSPDVPKTKEEYRLPENVRPTHYDLIFKTDLDSLTFSGFGTIDLDILQDTSSITFNSSGLKLQKCTILSGESKTEAVESSQTEDSKTERVTAQFGNTLSKGSKVQLRLGWEGELKGNMLGYYFSSAEHEGKKRYYALTQFEPTAARRAFPSWDEPLLKATYTISLISREDTVNLSNMPVAEEGPYSFVHNAQENSVDALTKWFSPLKTEDASSRWKITRFEKSPPMSTYLVAFANGHFAHLESSYRSPLSGKVRPLRLYATPDIISQGQFALDVKAKVIPIYEQVFDVEYPLPKLDTLVASDFDAGAMENWGLITGRTSVFLFDPEKSDLAAKKRVATVQSHECAHMWFGDIVTMQWWDNLWLNEGFATLMGEVIIINKIFPEWKVQSEFINGHLGGALRLDAQRSSHPIEVDCPDANQINQIFDNLSYSKAGSMLRMLANFVGEEAFLKGVSIYLKKRLFGNSVTRDLWDGISEATGLDINTIMENWTLKIGFPVITVKEVDGGLQVRQDRFLSTGDASEEENKTIWYIPLTVLSTGPDGKAVVDHKVALDKREAEIKLDTSKPFKLNAGTVGVYRVAYSPERLAKLGAEAARPGSLFSLEDRMGLVSDAMELAKSGYAKTSGALNLIEKLKFEEEYLVWSSISTQLRDLSKVWWEQPQSVWEAINALRSSLFTPLVKKLGYEYSPDESTDIRQLRTLAITDAAGAEEDSVIEELTARFKHFQETGDDSRVPADLQRVIFATAVKHGGKKEWETVRKVWEMPPNPSSKIAAMLAMTASDDPVITDDTLNFLLESVPLQDWMYYFVGLNKRSTRRRLGNFFKDEYDVICKKFEGNFSLAYFVKYTFEGLTTTKDAEEVEAWFKDKDVSKYNLSLAQSLDSIKASAAWLDRDVVDVEQWLKQWEKRA